MLFAVNTLVVATIAWLAAVAPVQVLAGSVCASGQMAVGQEFLQEFTGPSGSFNVYAGFLMANNCGLISQNDLTEDSHQLCNGGYSHGASVSCDGNHNPVSAVDTKGQHWHCSTNNVGTGCNTGGSGGAFRVVACCDRD